MTNKQLLEKVKDEVRFVRDNCVSEWKFMSDHKFEFEAKALLMKKEAYEEVLSRITDLEIDLNLL